MDAYQSLEFLKKQGLPVLSYYLARNERELVEYSNKIGFPLVLKLVSSRFTHKIDVGGVLVGAKNKVECINFFNKMKEFSGFRGVLVQKLFSGTEVIIGVKKDPVFGQVVMFGLGGIFVQVFNDVTFRVCPITQAEARKMISEVKSHKLLEGVRTGKRLNIPLLASIISKVSELSVKSDIKELDINPFTLNDSLGFVVDARIIL